MKKMLSLEQAAEYMGVHKDTVRKLFKSGELKAYKVAKLWRTTEDDILMYINRPQEEKEATKRTRTRRTSQESVPIKYVNGRPHYV